MSVNKKDIVAEVEPIEKIEAEVEEVKKRSNDIPKTKEKFFTKDRMVRYGKNIAKVGSGIAVGFISAFVLGLTMAKDDEGEPIYLEPGSFEEYNETEESLGMEEE